MKAHYPMAVLNSVDKPGPAGAPAAPLWLACDMGAHEKVHGLPEEPAGPGDSTGAPAAPGMRCSPAAMAGVVFWLSIAISWANTLKKHED